MTRPVGLAVVGVGLIGRRHIEQDVQPRVTGRDGLETMRVVEAVLE